MISNDFGCVFQIVDVITTCGNQIIAKQMIDYKKLGVSTFQTQLDMGCTSLMKNELHQRKKGDVAHPKLCKLVHPRFMSLLSHEIQKVSFLSIRVSDS
jgi:trehalose/maltose hydrolase-like predicted phosphorylase